MGSINKRFEFNNLNLEECFKNFYVVPDYQREYVWGDIQVEQLLADIEDVFLNDNKKEFFLGTIVVYSNDSNLEIIDGQQRLTTLFLILCAFRSIYKQKNWNTIIIEQMLYNSRYNDKGKEISESRLVLQYKDGDEIINAISNENFNLVPSSISCQRLKNAYNIIKDNINSTCKVDQDFKSLFMYILRQIKFVQITAPEINDALKIFETINDRGIGLNPMDLLKNLIFRQVQRDDFNKLKIEWKKLVDILEKNNEKPLRFLRYFIMSNFPSENNDPVNKENIVREDVIYKWLSNPTNAEKCGYIKTPFKFIENLNENAAYYVQFCQGNNIDGKKNIFLDNISKLGGRAFKQHVIVFLNVRHFSPDMFNYLAKNIETYLFYYIFTKEQAKVFEKQFAKWDISLMNIDTFEELKDFVAKEIKPLIERKTNDFKTRFLAFHQDELQLYRTRYILAKIVHYIDQSRKGIYVDDLLDNLMSNGTEIEHILPQTPTTPILDDEEKKEYDREVGMLGNLTLIEKSMNAIIGNNTFQKKLEAYGRCPYYLTSSIKSLDSTGSTNTAISKINQFLRSYSNWDKNSISDRQAMLYNLALQIWKIE
jgi:uncharacterized protein with ParB-like and HNH nuclease domain